MQRKDLLQYPTDTKKASEQLLNLQEDNNSLRIKNHQLSKMLTNSMEERMSLYNRLNQEQAAKELALKRISRLQSKVEDLEQQIQDNKKIKKF